MIACFLSSVCLFSTCSASSVFAPISPLCIEGLEIALKLSLKRGADKNSKFQWKSGREFAKTINAVEEQDLINTVAKKETNVSRDLLVSFPKNEQAKMEMYFIIAFNLQKYIE
jgi:hypothetical protein